MVAYNARPDWARLKVAREWATSITCKVGCFIEEAVFWTVFCIHDLPSFEAPHTRIQVRPPRVRLVGELTGPACEYAVSLRHGKRCGLVVEQARST